jgi:ELWxxDGT repeat protein
MLRWAIDCFSSPKRLTPVPNISFGHGSEAGTIKLADDLGSTYLLTVGNKVYFTGFSATNGAELWETDGTAAGTKLLADVLTGVASSFAAPLLVDGNVVYFMAESNTSLEELWRYNVVTKVIEPLKNDDRITVFPNPTEGVISFRFDALEQQFQSYQVFDNTGRLIAQATLAPQSDLLTLDTRTWAQGTYLVRFIGKDKQAVKRFVKTD